jgi:hypothetical protein
MEDFFLLREEELENFFLFWISNINGLWKIGNFLSFFRFVQGFSPCL